MPEIPMCRDCHKTINKASDDYVITNKEYEHDSDKWQYAHLDCYNDTIAKEEAREKEREKSRQTQETRLIPCPRCKQQYSEAQIDDHIVECQGGNS